MKKIYYLLPLLFIASCSQNLIKNPGAETLPLKEWTSVSGKWTQRKKSPSPAEGTAYFFPAVVLYGELYQDIDVGNYSLLTNLGLAAADYTAYMRVFPQDPTDQSYEIIEFKNVAGTVLDSIVTPHCDSTNTWIKFTKKQALPKGTQTIRVRLISQRYNGSNNDGYHDNLSLTVSLSWWVYLIVIIIILLILWLLIKKKKKTK